MGSPSIPAQPPPPDYSTINRDAIITDIETLPLRRRTDRAAQMGQIITYQDPRTGETRTLDFTGTGDADYLRLMSGAMGEANAKQQRDMLALRQELGLGNVQQTVKELEAADPQGFALRQGLMSRGQAELNQGSAAPAYSGNIASAENRLWNLANAAPGSEQDQRLADLYQRASQRDRRLGSIYDEATRLPGDVADLSAPALQEALERAQQEFRRGAQLDDDTRREVLNDVRAGQVARGNFLGDAAAVAEATELGRAGEERRQRRLENLLNVQQRAFGQGSSLRQEGQQNRLSRLGLMSGLQGQEFGQEGAQLGQLAGLQGQDFGQRQQAYQTGLGAAQAAFGGTQAMADDQRRARAEAFGYDQQRLANAQSIGLGSPIVNQFSGLGGAQQGAVGFGQFGAPGGPTVNPNAAAAAASFAQGIYGNQMNAWGTQAQVAANQPNQLLQAGSAAATAIAMYY